MHLLRRIERYLRATKTPATRFGREAVRDPRFVFDLRSGREPRPETERRVHVWLDAREEAAR
jgi:2,4-dienoyl-CoA reductase-like NADH-dependent reductase (Old Yellow Enzyme family)